MIKLITKNVKKYLFILTSLLSLSFICVNNEKIEPIDKKTPTKVLVHFEDSIQHRDTIIDESDSFTIDNLKKYLIQIDAPHPHIIYAIGKQESGYCSFLFKTHNNLFGMTRPNKRTNKSIQNRQKWGKFKHWTHSVDDFIMWAQWTTRGKVKDYNEMQFLNHIDKSYAHDGYSNVIKKHFDTYLD
jgi:uncharacterized FlgJ-related protein